MDLTTIRKKLDHGVYVDLATFEADLLLMCDNAMAYNEEGTEVYDAALHLRQLVAEKMEDLREHARNEVEAARSAEGVCSLCLNGSLKFEPVTYYCQVSKRALCLFGLLVVFSRRLVVSALCIPKLFRALHVTDGCVAMRSTWQHLP